MAFNEAAAGSVSASTHKELSARMVDVSKETAELIRLFCDKMKRGTVKEDKLWLRTLLREYDSTAERFSVYSEAAEFSEENFHRTAGHYAGGLIKEYGTTCGFCRHVQIANLTKVIDLPQTSRATKDRKYGLSIQGIEMLDADAKKNIAELASMLRSNHINRHAFHHGKDFALQLRFLTFGHTFQFLPDHYKPTFTPFDEGRENALRLVPGFAETPYFNPHEKRAPL